MSLWSISFAYRLGLAFHSLNNEGSDGGNLMQPRRIDVGKVTYDGISGEIIRRHILEYFVNVCRERSVPVLPLSDALHPDRGPLGILAAARSMGLSELRNEELYSVVRKAITSCAVLDVGGYLAAWQDQTADKYVAEKAYTEVNCAKLHRSGKQVDVEVVKRESCFDVAWLISEEPQDLTVTQHSAFRDTFEMNSRYSQTMRSNVYAGVLRADLHRIGTDDYWHLQSGTPSRLAITAEEQYRRQMALIRAIAEFIASPTGAKVAGWAPHVFLTEGAILLSSSRTAPFTSPLKVNVNENGRPVQRDSNYRASMTSLHNDKNTWVWSYEDVKGLLGAIDDICERLKGDSDGEKGPAAS